MFDYFRDMASQNFVYLHPKIFDMTKKTNYCFCLEISKSDCEAVRNLEVKWEKDHLDEIVADKWKIIWWSCHIGFLWLSLIIELN